MTLPLAPARSNSTHLKLDSNAPSAAQLDRIAELLRSGELVVAPTETRYGLLACVADERAIARLCAAKRRATKHPVSVFVRSLEEIAAHGSVTDSARLLAETFLPGPLTLVLKNVAGWRAPLAVDGKTGFRVSSSPLIDGLLDRVGAPLTATSANLSGRPDEETVGAINHQLGETIAMYIDGGRLDGLVSTVVDCSGKTVRVLRESAISRESLAKVVKLTYDE